MEIIVQTYNGMNEYTHKHYFSKKKTYTINKNKVTRINNNGLGCFTIWQGSRPKNIWYYSPDKYWIEENGRSHEYWGNPNWKKGQTFFALDLDENGKLMNLAKSKGIFTLEQEWY